MSWLSWLKNLRLQVKLMSGFGLMALLSAIMVVFALTQMASLEAGAQTLYEKHVLGTQHILLANTDLVASGRAEKNAILAETQAEVQRHADSAMTFMESAIEEMTLFEETIVTQVTRDEVAEIRARSSK